MAFRNILAVTPYGHEDFHRLRGFRKEDPVSHLDFIPLIRAHGIRRAQELIAEAVAERRPDLLLVTLFGDNYQFPVSFFAELRRLAPLVFWFYDDENTLDVHGKYYGQAADAVVTTDYFGASVYRRMGVPAVYDPPRMTAEIFHPVSVGQDIDVCFLGDCTKSDRMDFVRFLLANGVKVETFGKGSKNGRVDKSRISELYCRAKINLNFSKIDDLGWTNEAEPLLNRVRQSKSHPMEIALARSFCLTEYYPALPHLFEIGKEIDYFCDKGSLLAKARHYLEHDDERRAAAEAGHRRALAEYEAAQGIEGLLEKIEAALRRPPCPASPTAYMNDGARERRVNVLFVHLLAALGKGQFRAAFGIVPDLFEYGLGTFVLGAWGGVRRGVSILRKRPWGRILQSSQEPEALSLFSK